MHFKHRQQYDFVIGSLIAALVGVTLNAYQARLKEDKQLESATQNELDRAKDLFQFGFVHHTSLALCAMLSVAFYKTNLSSWEWTLATVNLLGKLHIYKFLKILKYQANIPILWWDLPNNIDGYILAVLPIPSHIKPDENIPQATHLPVRMTKNNDHEPKVHLEKYGYSRIDNN